MKKSLSIALLLFSIAAPSATYSDEAPRNVEKTSASVEAQKKDSIKLATRKRRCCALLLVAICAWIEILIFMVIYSVELPANITSKDDLNAFLKRLAFLGTEWPVVVILYVAGFFLDLFFRYLLGMKVVDTSGKDASWTQLLIRHIVKWPPLAFVPLFLFTAKDDYKLEVAMNLDYIFSHLILIQAIIIFVREDRRSLSDLAAKTVVVMRDESTSDSNKSTLA